MAGDDDYDENNVEDFDDDADDNLSSGHHDDDDDDDDDDDMMAGSVPDAHKGEDRSAEGRKAQRCSTGGQTSHPVVA